MERKRKMDKKFPMKSAGPNKDPDIPIIKIELEGLDEVFATALDNENFLVKYEKFAEHVILSCAMPEIPRYTIHDGSLECSPIPQAFEMLDSLLVRYRRMTAWMRRNGIDPEAVAGKPDDDSPAKN